MSQLSEDDLIATLFAPMAGPGGLALRDDAALLATTPGCDLVVTVDALVAGVHFFADDPAGSIARKALGVNLSDLAAKGARPSGFVLSLALPPDWTTAWLTAFAAGLEQAAHQGTCPLLGGDTVRTSGPLTLSITAFGEVPQGRMVRRTGARPGDSLYVSGTIGDAALGLGRRRTRPSRGPEPDPETDFLIDRYLHPQPRLGLVDALQAHASGAMDISDGLVGDLAKMARASGVSAVVDLGRIPLSAAAQRVIGDRPAAFATAVTGGDDYEILATVPPGQGAAFVQAAAAQGVSATEIGTVVSGTAAPVFRDHVGRVVTFAVGSFSHF